MPGGLDFITKNQSKSSRNSHYHSYNWQRWCDGLLETQTKGKGEISKEEDDEQKKKS